MDVFVFGSSGVGTSFSLRKTFSFDIICGVYDGCMIYDHITVFKLSDSLVTHEFMDLCKQTDTSRLQFLLATVRYCVARTENPVVKPTLFGPRRSIKESKGTSVRTVQRIADPTR